MPIIADPQKLSMPQQVQQNKKDIENIYKIIDGLDTLDNVVVVPNISHILTAQELKAIEQPVAFIIYSNKVYLKRKIESGIAYFDRVFSISGSTVITFDGEEIQATLSNGALSLISTSVSTYSKSEIDSNFAKLTGANFSGPITAKTIKANEPEFSLSFNIDAYPTNASLSFEVYYAGIEVYNNILYLVLELGVKNNGSSPYSGTIGFQINSVPYEVGSKIYRRDGTTINNPYSSDQTITKTAAVYDAGGTNNLVSVPISSNAANRINGYFPTSTIAAGETNHYSARTFLKI